MDTIALHISSLSLHDALPISVFPAVWAFLISGQRWNGIAPPRTVGWLNYERMAQDPELLDAVNHTVLFTGLRSEEHTSELQSPCNLECRLLLEKKNHKLQLVN